MIFVRDSDCPVPIFFSGDRPACIECPFVHIIGDFKEFECWKTKERIKHIIGGYEICENCPLVNEIVAKQG